MMWSIPEQHINETIIQNKNSDFKSMKSEFFQSLLSKYLQAPIKYIN